MTATTLASPAHPGALLCQKDSSIKELTTRVHAIELVDGAADSYDVELEDTILFPEGGGQPWDTGLLNGSVEVKQVIVKSGRCLHRVSSREGPLPFSVGDSVRVTVDWERRFDHMQQHSGQHLLSAICEKYGYDTTTWSLGEERCNIELVPFAWNEAAKKSKEKVVPSEVLQQIETDVNTAIVSGKSMRPKFVNPGEPEWEQIASKFPEGERPATLRIVVIDDIDANPCCGTHVQQLAQLQSLRILNTEYARGATRVWFVVGNRVNREFTRMFRREQQLTKLLSCAPEEHAARVDKLQQAQRVATKEIKALQKELASAVALELLVKASESSQKVVHYHRDDADVPFFQAVVSSLGDAKDATVFVLTAGDVSGEGSFLIAGPQAFINQHGKSVITVIDGKGGGGKNGILQGKAKALSNIGGLTTQLQTLLLS